MDIEMPFANGRPSGPSGVWDIRPESPPIRSSSLSVDIDSLSLSRSSSPSFSLPLTPDLLEMDLDRPRSASSISTILPATPDCSSDDDSHAISNALDALKTLPRSLRRAYSSSSIDSDMSDDSWHSSRDEYAPRNLNSKNTPKMPPTPLAGPSMALVSPRRPQSPPAATTPTRTLHRSKTVILSHVAARRKMSSPLTPTAASSLVGKHGTMDETIRPREFGTIGHSAASSFTSPSRISTTPRTISATTTSPSKRVAFNLPLFAISERKENEKELLSYNHPTTVHPDTVLSVNRGAQVKRRVTLSDEATVKRFPWGARKATPIPAEVVEAVRRMS